MELRGFEPLTSAVQPLQYSRPRLTAKSLPGGGRRIAYRREDIFRWAVALEFAEFGIDPTEIKKLLDLNWPQISHVVLEAKDGPDKYLCFHPNLLGRLSREGEREASGKPGAPYSVTIAIVSDLAELNQQAKTDQARATLDQFRARYGMINLSRLRRQVEATSCPLPRFADETFRHRARARAIMSDSSHQRARFKERSPRQATSNVP